ncbi:hypothetical protein DVH24_027602 [Malus domestica]|uniref:Uncharacterized protein n=1 Tax=Malus domestica TaxID=3750 RepID=A0A498HDE4_MALDO|nr:hypothetical protein DVH24_027602 [Malus domestica]
MVGWIVEDEDPHTEHEHPTPTLSFNHFLITAWESSIIMSTSFCNSQGTWVFSDDSECDLRAIPGKAASLSSHSLLETENSGGIEVSGAVSDPTQPLVLVN